MTDLDVTLYAISHIKQWGLWSACRYCKNRGIRAEFFIKTLKQVTK